MRESCDLLLNQLAIGFAAGIEVSDDFGKAEQSHGQRGKTEAVSQFGMRRVRTSV